MQIADGIFARTVVNWRKGGESMKETKKKMISRFCLFCVAAALLAAVILAPRPGVNEAKTDLIWDGALRESAEQISRAKKDGFYLVQRGERQYLALRGYGRAYEAPDWRLEGKALTLSVQSRPGGHSGVRLYRICVEGYDSIYAEENGQKEVFQTVFVVGTGRRPYSV